MPSINVSDARKIAKSTGTCLNFVSGIVTLGTANPFTGSFYVTMHVKWFGSNGTYQHLFSKRDSYSGSTMMFDLYLDATTNILSIDTTNGVRSSTRTLPINKWCAVTWVHNTTTSKEQFYIDGELYAEAAISAVGTGTTALISIGATQSPAIENFNGLIDEVAIGTGAPSYIEVLQGQNQFRYLNLWGYYKFDEGSGAIATDSSGNANDGAISGATYATDAFSATRSNTPTAGIIPLKLPARSFIGQKALSFNGTTSKGTIANLVPDTAGFSIGFWIYNTLKVNDRIVSWTNAATTPGFEIACFSGDNTKLRIVVISNGGSVYVLAGTVTNMMRQNAWTHIAFTYKPAEFKTYINGVLFHQQLFGNGMDAAGTFPFTFSSRAYLSEFSKFKIAEFVFKNGATVWTAAEVKALYEQGIIPANPTCLLTWNDTATDQSGNGNNATLTSTVYTTSVPSATRTAI